MRLPLLLFALLGAFVAAAFGQVMLNEMGFLSNNNNNFIELRGPASGTMDSDCYVVQLDGTEGTDAGDLIAVFDVSELDFGASGLILLLDDNGAIDTSSLNDTTLVSETTTTLSSGFATTFVLACGFASAPTITDDWDPQNNGTLVLPDGAQLVDAVGWSPETGVDFVYASAALRPRNASFDLDAFTRFRSATATGDSATASAWYGGAVEDVLIKRGGPSQEYMYTTNPDGQTTNFPGSGGELTPGNINLPPPSSPPPPPSPPPTSSSGGGGGDDDDDGGLNPSAGIGIGIGGAIFLIGALSAGVFAWKLIAAKRGLLD